MKKMIKRAVVLALVLTLLTTLLVPAAVFAEETGTVEVSGNVPATLTLTVPAGPIALGTLVVGATKESTNESITVGTNDPLGLTLKVRDNIQAGENIGKMVSDTNVLTNPLKVKGGDITPNYTALTTVLGGYVTIITTGTAAEITIADFSVQQEVLWNDPVATGYSITLYFIAANNTE